MAGNGQSIRLLLLYFLLQSSFVLKLKEVFEFVYYEESFPANDFDDLISGINHEQNLEQSCFDALYSCFRSECFPM